MKIACSIISLIILATISFNLRAQSDVREFDVDGLKVIFKKIPNEVVAARLYVRGGTSNYSAEQQGVENLAFELALFGGTERRSADVVARESQKFGVGLSAKSGYDYGYIGMTALKKFWDSSWDLWVDALMQPAMPLTEFERIRDEVYARQRRSNASPEEYVDELAMTNTYAGTDYEKLPTGTEGSLYDLTLEDVQLHYKRVVTKANCFLVVVGGISEDDLIQKVSASFAELPMGSVENATASAVIEKPGATIVHRDLDINHIDGRMPAPGRYDKGGVENMMAMSLLSDRFARLAQREYDMVYAPTVSAGNLHRHPFNRLYVATANPRSSIDLIVNEINRIRDEGFTESEFDKKKPAFLTYHYLGIEMLDAQAHVLGDAEVNGGWRKSEGLSSAIRNMNLESLNAVFREYNDWISWTYLGNSSQVQPDQFKQPKTKEE